MPERSAHCATCKRKRKCTGKVVQLANGRWQFKGTCPDGHKVVTFVAADKRKGGGSTSGTGRAKGGSVPRQTRTNTPKGYTINIPVRVETDVETSALWTMCEGLLAALRAQNVPTAQGVAAQAKALHQQATGGSSEADTAEMQVGAEMAKLLGFVAVQMGMTAQDWAALMPAALRQAQADRSSPGGGGILGLLEQGVNSGIGAIVQGVVPVPGVGGLAPQVDIDGDGRQGNLLDLFSGDDGDDGGGGGVARAVAGNLAQAAIGAVVGN